VKTFATCDLTALFLDQASGAVLIESEQPGSSVVPGARSSRHSWVATVAMLANGRHLSTS